MTFGYVKTVYETCFLADLKHGALTSRGCMQHWTCPLHVVLEFLLVDCCTCRTHQVTYDLSIHAFTQCCQIRLFSFWDDERFQWYTLLGSALTQDCMRDGLNIVCGMQIKMTLLLALKQSVTVYMHQHCIFLQSCSLGAHSKSSINFLLGEPMPCRQAVSKLHSPRLSR